MREYSPQLTGRVASAKGSSQTRCRGPSLSKAKPVPSWPISTRPPSNSRHAKGRASALRFGRRLVGGLQRVLGQEVLGVHQQKLLVLLLMMKPEFDKLIDTVVTSCQQCSHRVRDVAPIGQDFPDPGPGDHAALRPRMPRTDRLVVGIEKIFIGRVEHPVVPRMRPQHEGLEEPRRVGQVPFGRTGVRHRLDRLVLRR